MQSKSCTQTTQLSLSTNRTVSCNLFKNYRAIHDPIENIRKECGFSAIPKNQHDLYYAREEGFFIPISLQQHEGFAICTMPDRRAFVVRSWLPE